MSAPEMARGGDFAGFATCETAIALMAEAGK